MVTERVHLRRRASDRADERAARAAKLGDLIGLWVASGQAEEARRRRAEWQEHDDGQHERHAAPDHAAHDMELSSVD
jgi:hypothetical protein